MAKSKLPNFNTGHILKKQSQLEEDDEKPFKENRPNITPQVEELKLITNNEIKKPEPKPILKQTEIIQPKVNSTKTKELKVGETLIGTKSGKFNGHLVELFIFYGNFVKPMIRNKESGELEFITIVKEEYDIMLEDFLSSEEGRNYRVPTKKEMYEAYKIVQEKEAKYMDSLQAKKQKEEEFVVKSEVIAKTLLSNVISKKGQPETIHEETVKEEKPIINELVEKPKLMIMDSDKEDNKKDLKFVDDIKSYEDEELDKYRKQGFTEAQLRQIEEGLNNEIDVSHFAYKDMTPAQMERERKKLQYEMGLANEAKDKFNQDYTETKQEREEEILKADDEKEVNAVKATVTIFGAIIFALLCVAGCIILVTILIKAFKLYSTGLF